MGAKIRFGIESLGSLGTIGSLVELGQILILMTDLFLRYAKKQFH